MSKTNCPGSSTLTDDGKACEVKLDFPLYCGLTADSVPGWPRCYDDDAKFKLNGVGTLLLHHLNQQQQQKKINCNLVVPTF